jgi:hypothetical protein
MNLHDLLNPEQPVNASANLRAFHDLLGLLNLDNPLLVPSDIQRHLQNLISSWMVMQAHRLSMPLVPLSL